MFFWVHYEYFFECSRFWRRRGLLLAREVVGVEEVVVER
jgi:hypothetical protein